MRRSRLQIAIPSLLLAAATTAAVSSATFAAEPTVIVEPGDTLSEIALEHGLGVDDLAALNALANPNRILAGQVLRLPDAAAGAQPAAPATAGPATASARTHTVAPGENLTWIARRYGVTVAAIVSANGIADASRIYAGQKLVIPGVPSAAPAVTAAPAVVTSVPAPATASARTHTVTTGENLTWIARRYGVTVAGLVSANGIADASRIYAGQRLVIPGAAGTSAAPRTMGMPAEMAAIVAQRDAVRAIIVEEAGRYGVPVAFALAVAWQESGWQQGVTSHAGAIGVMQLLPSTAEWVGSSMLGAAVDPADTRSNVRAGVRLLAHYLSTYEGSRELALSAYYQGQAATDRHGIYPVTRPYIASVLALEALFAN